jgi:Tol biopolymer transport system component
VPSLSHDGNWSAFQAADANKKYDVYFMNTTSGEARRITLDSSSFGIVADLSADASHIVFDRYNAATRHMEIALVSTIGGLSRKIVDVGFFPRWRPDGDRIGYIRDRYDGSQSGKSEFWTVNSNGSENRCEFTDSLSRERGQSGWMVFSWSPDGQAVCWVRSYSAQWQEVMVYDLASKRERQVTFDKKRVSDVCWAPNNQIIYSSDKAGNFNLWMVPASGGDAIQLTKGASPDMSGVISRDGSKVLCYQQQELSHIWIAGTDGSSPHQITFDDAFLWRVAFTPDNKEIVFGFHQPLGREKGARVCSIDRDGKNRKELTSREEVVGNPLPSPDGRWIVYGGRSLEEPFDSMKVYLIDAKNPGLPKLVCVGCPFRWIDPKTFISMDTDTTYRTWLNAIEGGQRRTFFEDSTFAIPLQGGKYIGYSDGRSASRGLWVSAAPGVNDPSLRSPKKLLESPVPYGEFDKSGRFYYFVRNAGELRRISIPSGKEEIVRGTFPGLNPTFYHSTLDISYDGREIVYTDARYDSKLIMIEHPFN